MLFDHCWSSRNLNSGSGSGDRAKQTQSCIPSFLTLQSEKYGEMHVSEHTFQLISIAVPLLKHFKLNYAFLMNAFIFQILVLREIPLL